MGSRSYLFPGQDVEHLNPQQRMLEKLYDQIDRPGNRLTPSQFFASPEAAQLLDQLFGSIADRVPPGSQIINQTPGKVVYRDADGYEHNVVRKPDGTFSTTTNRPAVLPNQQQQNLTRQFGQQIQQAYSQPVAFANLPPELRTQLQAISAARQAQIDQQIGDQQGQLLARLFGQGVQRSSIATNAGARFAEAAGRLQQQESSDAATREIGLRQYLTEANQGQNRDLANLYGALAGLQNQRDIAGAGLDLDMQKLQEASRQFDLSHYLDSLRTQTEQEKLDAANSGFNKFLSALGAGGQLASGIGSGLAAYKALFPGDKK